MDALVSKLRAGDSAARDPLIQAHMRLAMTIVSHYTRRHRRRIDELVSVALLTLAESVERAGGALLDNNIAAYLTDAIGHALNRYITEDVLIRIPSTVKRDNDLPDIKIGSLSNKIFKEEKDGYEDARSPKLEAAITARSTKGVDKIWERLASIVRTDLEREIVNLKSQGYRNKEVAEILGITAVQVSLIKKRLEREYFEQHE